MSTKQSLYFILLPKLLPIETGKKVVSIPDLRAPIDAIDNQDFTIKVKKLFMGRERVPFSRISFSAEIGRNRRCLGNGWWRMGAGNIQKPRIGWLSDRGLPDKPAP